MTPEENKETQEQTTYSKDPNVQQALLDIWHEYLQNQKVAQSKETIQLPFKVERIIAVAAKKWSKEYGGSTIGILGQDAIELCEKYGIDWENYY